jgi:ubiquinone/menaquinone biosynthesis C-methylase UbiE
VTTQQDVRRWWTDNPMVYDWSERPDAVTDPEYLADVERRFLSESWFAQAHGAKPYSRLIPFAELEGKDVLEVGCGSGVHAKLLAEAGARLTAIDLTPTAVEMTRKRLELNGLEGAVIEADAEALPFDDAAFDFVWSWGVIHHSRDTSRVIAEIARVLRPGGRLAFMVYHRSSITYWFNYVFVRGVLGAGLRRESPDELANRWSDGVIARHYTRESLVKELAPHFEGIKTEVMGQIGEAVPLPARVRARVAPFVPLGVRRAALRRWGWFLFASARKRA